MTYDSINDNRLRIEPSIYHQFCYHRQTPFWYVINGDKQTTQTDNYIFHKIEFKGFIYLKCIPFEKYRY